jgi:lipopolysaccharide biosynthesis regulator YciM
MVDYLLLLLLPVAVYVGWWLARALEKRKTSKRNRLFSNQYFQGLNYLLNEQPDKAIQVFLELAEVNQDTVETHLALGSLFRRRGEVDRAIRFHQNIIAKPGLEPEQRAQALLELGEDYMSAGLLDRAERLFAELIESDAHTPSALNSLLEIYQQEKDWENALIQARRLESVKGEHMGDIMAQFCCELAESALASGDREQARRHLRQARRHHPNCVRARFILANVSRQEGDYEAALNAYEEIAGMEADYIPDLLQPYLDCAESAGQVARSREHLEQWAETYDGISLVLKITEFITQEQGAAEAIDYLLNVLISKPSVRGLDHLVELRSVVASSSDAAGGLQNESSDDVLKAVTTRLMARRPGYRCTHCGFSGQSHHWQCPSCRHWSTTRTIHGVLGE